MLVIAGEEMIADASGALYWAARRLLIVADLHLEKGSCYALRGVMLPPYDTRATLAKLSEVLARVEATTVVALGDSFHDSAGAARLDADNARTLKRLQKGRTWVWVRGNHDPNVTAAVGGEPADQLEIAGIMLRHEPSVEGRAAEIAGHLHPAARLVWNGASVRKRCFAGDGRRVVMPAFGTFTGGLNLLSEPFVGLFGGRPATVDMIGAAGVYRVPPAALIAD